MARRDYYDDPDAPKPSSIVPAVTAVVEDDQRSSPTDPSGRQRPAGPCPGARSTSASGSPTRSSREVREETGIEVEVLGLTGVYSDPKHVIAYDDGEVRQQFALSFPARPVGGSLRDSDESSEVRWLAAADLDDLDIHPSMRLRIQHGLDQPLAAPYIG